MLGAIVGDISGSRYEFGNHKSKEFTLLSHKEGCAPTDDSIMTLAVAKALMETEDKNGNLHDQNYSPKKSGQQLIRIVDDFPPGDYTIEAGFILKDDKDVKYPCYYSKSFSFRR